MGGHSSTEPATANGCLLTVYVPFDAKVMINGKQTKATGSRREFVSYGLQPGYTYTYQVTAEIPRERVWSSGTQYAKDQVVRSAQGSGDFFKVVEAGTSGSALPANVNEGQIVHDGTATLIDVGPDYRGPGYLGATMTQTQTVALTAGARDGVAFGFNVAPPPAPTEAQASN